MSSEATTTRVLYENLDTSFVNIWALLRYLSQRSFVGRVHVELENYSADVFVNGSEVPSVHEVDLAAGTDVVEEAALHRLVLRARESSGSITVYEGADEVQQPSKAVPAEDMLTKAVQPLEPAAIGPESRRSGTENDDDAETVLAAAAAPAPHVPFGAESQDAIKVSGELIGAIERVAQSLESDFASLFREVRISLADDYTFLDPIAEQLHYENSAVAVNGDPLPRGYVTGISESLRGVVDRLASGTRERRTRERIALELARIARKNSEALVRSGFNEQLDRIAGTKVI